MTVPIISKRPTLGGATRPACVQAGSDCHYGKLWRLACGRFCRKSRGCSPVRNCAPIAGALLVVGLGALLVAPTVGRAQTSEPYTPPRLAAIVANSDLVGLGTIVGAGPAGPPPRGTSVIVGTVPLAAQPRPYRIRIIQVLKGTAPSSEITVDELRVLALSRAPTGSVRIFFAREYGHGYNFTNQLIPFAPAAAATAPSGPVLAVVEGLLGGVLAAPGADTQDQWLAVQLLGGDPSPTSTGLLEAAAGSSNADVAFYAVTVLLGRNDPIVLPKAQAMLAESDLAPSKRSVLLGEIGAGAGGSAFLPLLTQLAQAKEASARLAAVQALGRSGVQATSLLAKALEDPSIEVREVAVRGLSSIYHQPQWSPIPGGAFEAHEHLYFAYWKEWLRENPVPASRAH